MLKPHEIVLLIIVAAAVLYEGIQAVKELYRRHKANAPTRLSRREREERIRARLNYSQKNLELQKHQWHRR